MTDMEVMRVALEEANAALGRGEAPVGSVLVIDGTIVAQAGNRELELCDPTAHAEVLVMREAGKKLRQHTFPDCTIYTTLWPCPMCANAMLRAKVPRVVCGARSFDYIYQVTFDSSRLVVSGPIMETECRGIFVKWAKMTGREFILGEGDQQP